MIFFLLVENSPAFWVVSVYAGFRVDADEFHASPLEDSFPQRSRDA
jgi:hypothetical protein